MVYVYERATFWEFVCVESLKWSLQGVLYNLLFAVDLEEWGMTLLPTTNFWYLWTDVSAVYVNCCVHVGWRRHFNSPVYVFEFWTMSFLAQKEQDEKPKCFISARESFINILANVFIVTLLCSLQKVLERLHSPWGFWGCSFCNPPPLLNKQAISKSKFKCSGDQQKKVL